MLNRLLFSASTQEPVSQGEDAELRYVDDFPMSKIGALDSVTRSTALASSGVPFRAVRRGGSCPK